MSGWIGVDLDGTLAYYDQWRGSGHIGPPVAPMVRRVARWLQEGREVRIFTARAFRDGTPERDKDVDVAMAAIKAWCILHLGVELEVTCVKDFSMIELWDDRAIQVIYNTGRPYREDIS